MKIIQVTVYLKSGGNVTTEIADITMKGAKSIYYETFHSDKLVMIHEENNGETAQIIPIDNIAFINLEEVAE